MKEEVDVLVKMEPRVEGEELMENEYHPQLDPLVLRAETELWCDCPAEGELHSVNFSPSHAIKIFRFWCRALNLKLSLNPYNDNV